ncbi:MAG TPA: CoA-binding protein [Paracoccus sp. (in: a-proteobacteria)]|uniref:CoA-binding protein n=1 Tax=uncultured Paracoccus sp. TaxID=189685 RepID=UPI002621BFCE|nr:CoA-binding protein [uncultured Paracoccus sp.]HMQ39983.1 CoA-binding protein [Paracoccus sp. (in: a-proteobacteria)]HMR37615.1 CoA-binding protein [Paracoccus sp. (in: a-proteobacteria)]
MTEAEIIRQIRDRTRTIAVVGLSPKQDRPSWGVARFLQARGYRIIPVNPGHAGAKILGETVYADLSSVPADAGVDMVDIFRRSEAVPEIVDEALRVLPDLKTIWMQLGVSHPEAAAKAEAAGMVVIQDRCPKIEFPRLD